jgi:hypothetical protein
VKAGAERPLPFTLSMGMSMDRRTGVLLMALRQDRCRL